MLALLSLITAFQVEFKQTTCRVLVKLIMEHAELPIYQMTMKVTKYCDCFKDALIFDKLFVWVLLLQRVYLIALYGMEYITRYASQISQFLPSKLICIAQTNIRGGATLYGYPDDTYFARVRIELAAKGIVDKQEARKDVRS